MILYKYLINNNLEKQNIPEKIGSGVGHLHVVSWLFYPLLLGSLDTVAAHTKKIDLLMNQISKRTINSNIQFCLRKIRRSNNVFDNAMKGHGKIHFKLL